MKILTSFDDVPAAVKDYVDAEAAEFLEANSELVKKASEPVARAILAGQIGAYMSVAVTDEIRAIVDKAPLDAAPAIHDLRQLANRAAATFAPGFARMFGSLAMHQVVAPK